MAKDPSYRSESFKKRADPAAFFEAWVARILARNNLYTVHHPYGLASETGEDPESFLHSWDLDVSQDNKVFVPVEVKSVNTKFTCPEDFPFPTTLVCSKASWDRKWPGAIRTQRDFLMVSKLTGGIVWLPKGALTHVREVFDSERGHSHMAMEAVAKYLRPMSAFVDYIKGD